MLKHVKSTSNSTPENVINRGEVQTRDLGGAATTPEMTRAFLTELDILYKNQ